MRRTLVLLAIIVAALTLVLAVAAFVRIMAGVSSTLDFSAFYTAGRLVSEGLGDRLYNLELQAEIQRDVSDGNYDEPLPFAAPAFVAFAFLPLTFLPLRAAFGVMLAVNLVALALVLVVLRRAMTDVPPRLRALVLAATVAGVPTIGVLTAGQIDLLITGALLGGMLTLRVGRPVCAGAVFALAFAKPQLAVGALLLLLATREQRSLGAMLFGGAVLALAPVAAFGADVLFDNLTALGRVGRPRLMANWRGFLVSLGAPDVPWVWGPGWAALAAAGLMLSWRVWSKKDVRSESKWALAFALPLVLSPHLHGQSLVLVFPAIALYLQAEASVRRMSGFALVGDWEERGETLALGFFVLLFARWALALSGVSLTVFLLAALVAALALPDRWRLFPPGPSGVLERRAA